MKENILNDLVLSVKKQNLQVLNVIVRQHGEIIARHDFHEEKPVLLWSVSKTFTSMAVGIAMNEGYFKIDDHLIDFFTNIPQGFSGLYLTATQLSRFGQLILDRGVWKGKQLIPSSYIEDAASIQIDTSDFNPYFATKDHHHGYGYQIWLNSYPNSYRMDGLYGQYVVILPDKDAVITYVSNEPENMTVVLELTWDTLIGKLS